jgi:hypothetical protein
MPDDKSLDLVGLGRALEAIPDSEWSRVVSTATETFREVVRPITAVTGGTGRWLEQKFQKMVDVEQVLTADALVKVKRKLEVRKRSVSPTQNLSALN